MTLQCLLASCALRVGVIQKKINSYLYVILLSFTQRKPEGVRGLTTIQGKKKAEKYFLIPQDLPWYHHSQLHPLFYLALHLCQGKQCKQISVIFSFNNNIHCFIFITYLFFSFFLFNYWILKVAPLSSPKSVGEGGGAPCARQNGDIQKIPTLSYVS